MMTVEEREARAGQKLDRECPARLHGYGASWWSLLYGRDQFDPVCHVCASRVEAAEGR